METISINDLKNFEIDISLTNLVISLLTSIVCAYVIKIVYLKYAKTLNNKENFSDVFILLSITTTIVITVVKFSLALSLGLVGALSIVRFRAAIKEPEELVYLDLRLGHTCNIKCVMCSPHDSSKWVKDWQTLMPQLENKHI